MVRDKKGQGYFKRLFGIYSAYKIIIYSMITGAVLYVLTSKLKDCESFFMEFKYIIILFAVVILLILALNIKKISSKNIILLDPIVFYIFLSTLNSFLLFIPTIREMFKQKPIVFCGCLILMIVSIIIIGLRFIFASPSKFKNDQKYITLYDLNNIETLPENFVLIDAPTDEDLFNREIFKNEIIKEIDNFQCTDSYEKYVIALTGGWGTGKTSLIKSVVSSLRKKEKMIIIDEFDSCIYNDEVSMFRGVLNSLLDKLNIHRIDFNKIVDNYISQFIQDEDLKGAINILKYKTDDNRLVKIINECIEANGYKIVFIIDNIDRSVDNNIFLIYKMVLSILKFKNVVYLLSYDEKEIKKKFDSKDIDYVYIEKIINKKIELPELTPRQYNNTFINALNLIFKCKGLKADKVEKALSSSKIPFFSNLRQIILFLNNVLICFQTETNLDYEEYILLSLIKLNNLNLYEEIKNNGFYFVMEDSSSFFKDEVKLSNPKLKKEMIEKILSKKENKEYEEIVKILFPHVKYIMNNIIDYHNNFDRIDILRRKSINSGRFFYLYFRLDFSTNESVIACNKVQTFYSSLKKPNDVALIFCDIFDDLTYEIKVEFMAFICMNFYDENEDIKFKVVKFIFENYNLFDEKMMFCVYKVLIDYITNVEKNVLSNLIPTIINTSPEIIEHILWRTEGLDNENIILLKDEYQKLDRS